MINIINFLMACTTIASSFYMAVRKDGHINQAHCLLEKKKFSHNTHYNTYVFPQSLLGIAVDKDHKSHLHAGVIDYYVDIVNK